MQEYSRIELAVLDDFDVAIVRVDQAGDLTYMNHAAQGLFGCPAGAHIDLHMLFPDAEQYQLAVANLQQAPRASAATYHTILHRPCAAPADGPIPVRIQAFPDSGADGLPGGSIAFVDDLREDEVRVAINGALAASCNKDELLGAVAALVRTIIPFDEFHVTMVSKSRTRMRELYAKDEKRSRRELFRWWTMPEFIQANLQNREPEMCRVNAMRADPAYAALAKTDPDTKAFFDLGVREFLSLPVKHDNQVVGFVALYSYHDGAFSKQHLEQLMRLPLAEAVMAALHRDHDQRQQVIIDLLQRLGQRAVEIRQVADELVDDLLHQFEWEEWEHVSVFQYEEHTDRMCLICQANSDDRSLPVHFSMPATLGAPAHNPQPFNGPISEAALTGRMVNRPDERRTSPRAALPGFDPNGSQLALPIIGDGTRWVLYVESRVMNAFAEEEIEPLTTLAERAGAILAHSTLFEVQSAVLESIGDAVIEVSANGHIRWCNEAAHKMLGITPDAAANAKLLDLAADDGAAAWLRATSDFYHREVKLRRPGFHAPQSFLLSASTPEHLGGRVYVASSFTYQKEVKRLDELKEVFRQAALEGRVPLALAGAWLEEHAEDEPALRRDIDKILRQMARADLPLERLLRLSSPPPAGAESSVSDLGDALATTLAELPESLLEGIDAVPVTSPLSVSGEFNDIQFCIESMISFGVRTRPQSKKLRVSTLFDRDCAVLQVEGDWVPNSREGVPLAKERWRRKTLYDVTLGDSVIRRIIKRAGGTYSCKLKNSLFLAISLPVRTAAGVHR